MHLLSQAWTRFHIAATAAHPVGRLVEFVEHPDFPGVFRADVSKDEAAILQDKDQDDKTILDHAGWQLVMDDDDKQAAAAKLSAQIAGEQPATEAAPAPEPEQPKGKKAASDTAASADTAALSEAQPDSAGA